MERNVWRKGNGKGLYNGKKKSQNKEGGGGGIGVGGRVMVRWEIIERRKAKQKMEGGEMKIAG